MDETESMETSPSCDGDLLGSAEAIPYPKRWTHIEQFLSRNSPYSHENYAVIPNALQLIREVVNILVIGAGGLGCELLKDLAMFGFKNIDVIDMDTIDVSNLNRQFLFRDTDVGKPKALVAAEFIMNRVPGCIVKPHYNKIQDFDASFYSGFEVIVCGLDSIPARRWINGMLMSLLNFDSDGNVIEDTSKVIPMVDGGTEGFKGNARVVVPGSTACIECNLDLYPPQVTFPMCTIAHTPRLPEHCIEYIRLLLWEKEKPFGDDVPIDGDDAEHVQWIYERALARAQEFNIPGVTFRLTKGVIKHIIPAVASTNAVISAICATEVFKLITSCYSTLDNYMVFNDTQGVYTYSFQAERKEDCPACGLKPVSVSLHRDATLQDVVEELQNGASTQMKAPSLTARIQGNDHTLYMQSPPFLEQSTRPNLTRKLIDIGLQEGDEMSVTDPTSPKAVCCVLHFKD